MPKITIFMRCINHRQMVSLWHWVFHIDGPLMPGCLPRNWQVVGQWATPIRKAWWLKSPLRAQGPTTRAEASQLGSCHRFFMFFSWFVLLTSQKVACMIWGVPKIWVPLNHQCFSPPARWGSLDSIRVAFSSSSLSFSSGDLSGHCRTSARRWRECQMNARIDAR